MGLDELLVDPVEEVGLSGARRPAAGAELGLVGVTVPVGVTDVVQRDGELPHADVPDGLELVHQRLEVRVGAVAGAQTRGEGVGELHVIGAGPVHQGLDLGQLVRRVGVAPLVPEVGVVLRRVDVDVHLVRAVEVQLVQARGLRPRGSVETLDGAADGCGRPVPYVQAVYGPAGVAALREHLPERLRGVVRAGRVDAGEHDPARAVAVGPAGREHIALGGEPLRALDAEGVEGLGGGRVLAGATDVDRQPAGITALRADGQPGGSGRLQGLLHQGERGGVGRAAGDDVDGRGDPDAVGADGLRLRGGGDDGGDRFRGRARGPGRDRRGERGCCECQREPGSQWSEKRPGRPVVWSVGLLAEHQRSSTVRHRPRNGALED